MKQISKDQLEKGKYYLFYFPPKEDENFNCREFFLGQYDGLYEDDDFPISMLGCLDVSSRESSFEKLEETLDAENSLKDNCEIFELTSLEYLSNVIFENEGG